METYTIHYQNYKSQSCPVERIEIQASSLTAAKRKATALEKAFHHLHLSNQQGECVASKTCLGANRFLGWTNWV